MPLKKIQLIIRPFVFLLTLSMAMSLVLLAQTDDSTNTESTDSFMVDSVRIYLPNITVTAQRRRYTNLSPAERKAYWRRVRDVKKVYPFARKLNRMLIETFEYIETLPNDASREAHLRRVESDMVSDYKPKMLDYTLSQGKLLIKLIDRESGTSGFDIIKAVYGRWAASWYNMIAKVNGGNLKERYDPMNNPDDAVTERIIYLYNEGYLGM